MDGPEAYKHIDIPVFGSCNNFSGMSVAQFYEPFFSLTDFHDDTAQSGSGNRNQLVPGGRRTQQEGATGLFHPRIDIRESKENNIVTSTFELPGLKKEDVTIDVRNNRLTVSGETASSTNIENGNYVVRERGWGKFSRTVPLPYGTQAEHIKAKMNDGLLTVWYPKTSSAEKEAKRIVIE